MKRFIFAIFVVGFLFISCGEESTSGPDDGLIFNVPRLETTSGPSILDNPTADRGGFEGLCQKMQVYCNGVCLSTVGEQAGNCTLLQLNIGEAADVATDGSDLYYTAENTEILKMSLMDMSTQSLVTGLQNPSALYPTSGVLYFGNNPSSTNPESDVRVIFVGRPDVTVLTEHVGNVFGIHLAGDTLALAAGSFNKGPLYTFPQKGGRWKSSAAEEILHMEADGDNIYFSMNLAEESGIFGTSLSAPDTYSQVCSGDPSGKEITNFFVQGGFVYWFALKALNTARMYTKIPVTGGQKLDIQTAGSGALLSHNASRTFYSDAETAATESKIMSIPLDGGDAVVLGTCETNEVRAAVADATHLYVAAGYARTGAILRFDL